MMTYSQPPSYYYNHQTNNSKKSPEPRYYGSPATGANGSYSMTNSTANPRTLPPYISVQRASEPASPATIATTISSHSTPSPSPSRAVNMSANVSNPDFTLFDDAIIAAAHDLNSNAGKGRGTTVDVASTMADGSSNLTHYAPTGFPIIVPNDTSYSNYAPSPLYGNYSSNYSTQDPTSNIYNISQEQQQPSQRKFLRPTSMTNSFTSGQAEVEAIENVPALSPTSRQRNTQSPLRNKGVQTKSPRLANEIQTTRPPSYLSGTSTTYLHSAMPKLGRTISDAVQDELYNPELIGQDEQKPKSIQAKSSVYASDHIKSEGKHSFPHIFQEAQQQHQQDYSRNVSSHQYNRDRSPFRNTSPFHPTNNSYSVPYGPDNSLHQTQAHQALSQNQIAMALALREQMRKESEQAVAPKTISPRDSLLEYSEPDGQNGNMNLFPPLSNGRLIPQDDALSNGSLHASSQDGSDLDDFHSMATSRRASVANSSVSSHMDVPRFGYIPQQSSYDNMPTTQYYYGDAHHIPTTLPNDAASIPYIKEEPSYLPIQRPADTTANTGTYTCTYSGCGQRFTTSTKLQKHRREAHRKAASTGNSVSTAAAIASRNAQPGPHRCMRVNPSTGKPCNTVFSRPYDLTRHEDTIHNSAKEKVRCEICNDEKTFSRPDALVRHRRVKHGIH